MTLYESILRRIIEIPDHLKTQEMCIEAVGLEPHSLACVPDRFKTQEMCIKAAEENPFMLKYVPDQYKTQEMCDKAVCINPAAFFLFLTILKFKRYVLKVLR